MKKKFLALGVICFVLSFCASSQVTSPESEYVGYRELRVYEGITFDHLWKSCRVTLEDLDYKITWVNKKEGIYRAASRVLIDFITSRHKVYLTISISETEGKVALACEAKIFSARNPRKFEKKEAKRVFEQLDKFLVK